MKRSLARLWTLVAGWASRRTPAQLAACLALALLVLTLPVFIKDELNPFRQKAVFYYGGTRPGALEPEERRIPGSPLYTRKNRVFLLVREYLQGPRNLRLRHPGAVSLGAVVEDGGQLILLLKPAGSAVLTPEDRQRLREGLLRTLRENRLGGEETQLFWAGQKLDPI